MLKFTIDTNVENELCLGRSEILVTTWKDYSVICTVGFLAGTNLSRGEGKKGTVLRKRVDKEGERKKQERRKYSRYSPGL